MNDRPGLKTHGEKAWKTGRMKSKTEENNVDPKSNVRSIKKEQNGAYLSDRIFNYKMSGIASKVDQKVSIIISNNR
jgi:hypothetical protein